VFSGITAAGPLYRPIPAESLLFHKGAEYVCSGIPERQKLISANRIAALPFFNNSTVVFPRKGYIIFLKLIRIGFSGAGEDIFVTGKTDKHKAIGIFIPE
jgi:hypothetical protein